MAITYTQIGFDDAGTGASSQILTLDTTPSAGDLIVFSFSSDNGSTPGAGAYSVSDDSAGLSTYDIEQSHSDDVSTDDAGGCVATKVAVGDETEITMTVTSDTKGQLLAFAVSGVDTSSPVDGSSENTSDTTSTVTSHAAPSVTPTAQPGVAYYIFLLEEGRRWTSGEISVTAGTVKKAGNGNFRPSVAVVEQTYTDLTAKTCTLSTTDTGCEVYSVTLLLKEPGGATPVTVSVGQASETDSALPITATFADLTIPIGQATEADSALSVTLNFGAQTIPIGQASETDSAFSIDPSFGALSVPVGLASETDDALPITFSSGALSIAIGQASESDTALPITIQSGPLSIPVGIASEADSAFPVVPSFGALAISIGQATESDSAQPVTLTYGNITIPMGIASEADSALPINVTGLSVPIPIGIATETDSAFSIGFNVATPLNISIGFAQERDYALSVSFDRANTPTYKLKFEHHLTPIKKRGKVVLSEPLDAGSHLRVVRKTPIVSNFNAEPLKPFPTEQLEYALDKICYIQQEIEGHACDCRGDDYPGTPDIPTDPPGEQDLPECQPFSCDAFVSAAIAAELTAIDFREDFTANPPVMPLSGQFQLHGGAGGSNVQFYDSYKGQTLSVSVNTSGVNPYFAFPFGGDGSPDLCGDYTFGLGLGENSFGLPLGPKLWMSDAEGVALMHKDGFANSNNGNLFLLRRIEYQADGAAPASADLAINYDGAGTGFKDAFGSRTWGDRSWVVGTNFTYFYIRMSSVFQKDRELVPGKFAWFVTVTQGVMINGTKYELEFDQQLSTYSYTLQPMIQEPEFVDTAYMFSGTRGILYSLVTTTPLFDEDTLYKWYQRNFEDYELPDYCEFEGAELP